MRAFTTELCPVKEVSTETIMAMRLAIVPGKSAGCSWPKQASKHTYNITATRHQSTGALA